MDCLATKMMGLFVAHLVDDELAVQATPKWLKPSVSEMN
jgi:hypothetical protein